MALNDVQRGRHTRDRHTPITYTYSRGAPWRPIRVTPGPARPPREPLVVHRAYLHSVYSTGRNFAVPRTCILERPLDGPTTCTYRWQGAEAARAAGRASEAPRRAPRASGLMCGLSSLESAAEWAEPRRNAGGFAYVICAWSVSRTGGPVPVHAGHVMCEPA